MLQVSGRHYLEFRVHSSSERGKYTKYICLVIITYLQKKIILVAFLFFIQDIIISIIYIRTNALL